MKTILVTGSNGQLANCIKDIEANYKGFKFIYTSASDLDITNSAQVDSFFKTNPIDFCVNCAAYTAVDKAETDSDNAYNVNVIGAKNLALACNTHNVTLLHVSTDFVFDGKNTNPYLETDQTNPLGVYGSTKLEGEKAISTLLEKYYIIRTSWLYSEHGNNFMKTMLRLAEDRDELSVVADQIGSPTYATDLAITLLKIISSNNKNYGIYNYSNEGEVSWYDFAKAIFQISGLKIKVNPIKTEAYPTPAQRPQFSVLDKSKIKQALQIEIPYWKESLKIAIARYNA